DECDAGDLDAVLSLIGSVRPTHIINCSAYNQVDLAEERFDLAFRINATGARNLAYGARKHGAFLVHYSTDYVFDGTKETGLYCEDDPPHPLSVYGRSKYLSELAVRDETDRSLIFRVSWVFGEGTQNFVYKVRQWAGQDDRLRISSDEVSVPTATATIVEVTMRALDSGLSGLFHLTNSGYASRYEWARRIIDLLGLKTLVYPVPSDVFNLPAKRPKFSAMSNEAISGELSLSIPHWEEALKEHLARRD
ncbi:MAG TPA: dTDP-4-dehydrorhamnose reductase, partial [Dissulfurispiraceae bacterium]|nr:dTDP-4-dehydrorhamnose reductase [Dissulfurispiraceae bacterium]